MQRVEIGAHLVIDPEICHGKMTFKGTRVPVETVLAFIAMGYSVDMIVLNWPELSRSAVEEAITLASEALLAQYEASTGTVAEAVQ